MDRIAVIILGGGQGKRLDPLTKTKCKPAISFGGRYCLIDVPIANSLSSGLSKIFVIGQYLSDTLQRHLLQTYLYQDISKNQIQLLVPKEKDGKYDEYKGTADAVRQNLDYFAQISADYFLILSGDQIYNIDFQKMVNFAVDVKADMVIASQAVNKKEAKRMGVIKIHQRGTEIIDFYEKPKEEKILKKYYTDALTLHKIGYPVEKGKNYIGSMGIYLFKRQVLFDLLIQDPREDFGEHLIKSQLKKGDNHVFFYKGYWEDVGTIESYYHANLALTNPSNSQQLGLDTYDVSHEFMTKLYNLPGAQILNCSIKESLICEGSIVEGKAVVHSLLGVGIILGKGSTIRDSVVIGNDYNADLVHHNPLRQPTIGKNCQIDRTIIDQNVKIGDNVTLVNRDRYQNYDSPDGRIILRDGIMVIPRGTEIPNNYVF
ncbi:MAG: sugar phosphate nucleotidyltransferase [Chlamydiales bacterium]